MMYSDQVTLIHEPEARITQMNIELLGGVNEIGGNKVLVEHKGTRILLDFGMSFRQNGKFFSEFLKPRKAASLTDFFEFDLLPDLKGVYRQDYLKHMDRPDEDRSADALFLTHAHADHAQYIHFLRPDIPIYCSQATEIILLVLEKTGVGSFSEFLTTCPAFTFYINKQGKLSKVSKRNKEYINKREFQVMVPDVPVRVGSLNVEMVPVDHSLPGASGFMIYSDEGNLVYTGDIRFHGSNQHLSRKFVEKAKKARPRWLLCEGTRIDSTETTNEEDVKRKMTKLISKARGLVFVEHPIRDLDSVSTIFRSTTENNREFVVSLKLAYLIQALGDLCPFTLDDVKILVPRKGWGLIEKDDIDLKQIKGDYGTWEREFIDRKNSITCKDIQNDPSNYVVSMSQWEINQLIDIQPEGALWIKSSCEPFSEEMELDEERKQNWLQHFGIEEHHAHASGHASGDEIREMIRQIRPEELIPIHTVHPEMFVLEGDPQNRKDDVRT